MDKAKGEDINTPPTAPLKSCLAPALGAAALGGPEAPLAAAAGQSVAPCPGAPPLPPPSVTRGSG